MTYLNDRKNALKFSLSGLFQSFKREKHMQLHALAAMAVIGAGFYFRISPLEWTLVLACIILVMVVEIINTAIEKTCDLITLERRPEIKYIKDIAAGAVLLACLFSVACGLIIFVPYLRQAS